MSIRFKYFERTDEKVRTNEIVTYAGHLGAPEEMEDVEIKLSIDTYCNMNVSLVNEHYYTDDELIDINNCIQNLNWNEPFEDILFINLEEDELTEPYKLFKWED